MRLLLLILVFALASCSAPQSVEEILLDGNPDDYHIVYESTYGYFVVVRGFYGCSGLTRI